MSNCSFEYERSVTASALPTTAQRKFHIAKSCERLTVFPQPADLFEMMLSVHPVKLAPLVAAQGTDDGMVQQARLGSIFFFGLRDHRIHLCDDRRDLRAHLLDRHPL